MDRFEEDTQTNKLSRKISENPFMPVGIAGLIGTCIFGALKYKNKGAMSTSIYLIHLRVAAQSAVVGTLTLGCLYTIVKEHVLNKD